MTKQVSNPPTTYAEWADALTAFASGDSDAFALMRQGTLEWGPVVAERFTRRLFGALLGRMKAALGSLERDLRNCRDAQSVALTLTQVRARLESSRELSTLPCLPPAVKQNLDDEYVRIVKEAQSTLERLLGSGPLGDAVRMHPFMRAGK